MSEIIISQEMIDRLERRQIVLLGELICPVTKRNYMRALAKTKAAAAMEDQIAQIAATGPAQAEHWKAKMPEVKAGWKQSFRRLLYAEKDATE